MQQSIFPTQSSRKPACPVIFTYLDYRAFLKDMFEYQKLVRRRFSYRAFAKEAGFSTPNLLKLVIMGERKLDVAKALAVSKVFRMNKKETVFFKTLVNYDNAKNYAEKNNYYRKILSSRDYAAIKTLAKKQYTYFKEWYTPVVRELVTSAEYPGTPAWITHRIYPRITVSQVEKAIRLLRDLSLIQWHPGQKRFVQAETAVATPAEVASLAVAEYHKKVIGLGAASLDKFSSRERDVRSITLGVPEKAKREIQSRLGDFWNEILDFASRFQGEKQVYQLNMQFFPLTMEKKKG